MAASDLTSRDQAERAVSGAEMSIPLDQLHLLPALLQVFCRADNLGRQTLALRIEWAQVGARKSATTPRRPRLALRRSHLEPTPVVSPVRSAVFGLDPS